VIADAELIEQVRNGMARFERALINNNLAELWFGLRDIQEDALVLQNTIPEPKQIAGDFIIT
jgi:predicted RNA-binding protein with PUA domain